ncbi:MAG TPA: hypothetical protein VG937_13720 [Polyangiaceae bacterium]|nr:hypothetical protein [Polyangiaceae bacterium]
MNALRLSMPRARPKLMSTGQIEVEGMLYRVVESKMDAHCSVVREADGAVMGSFKLDPLVHPDQSALLPGALDPELVLSIAELLGSPRGLLPLQ